MIVGIREFARVGRGGGVPGEYRAALSVYSDPADSSFVLDGGASRRLFVDPDGRLRGIGHLLDPR